MDEVGLNMLYSGIALFIISIILFIFSYIKFKRMEKRIIKLEENKK